MRNKMIAVVVGTTLFVGWGMGGCTSVLPLIPVPVSLSGTGVAELDVSAGTPTEAKASFTGFDATVTIGRGSLELDPSVISVGTANGGAGKSILATLQQDAAACAAACSAAGVADATCTSVCTDGELIVTAWIGPADEVGTVCDTGDQYGPYMVSLDDGGQGVSVTPSSITITENTRSLLNGGSFSLCVEAISPIDGTVFINSIIMNVGL